MERAGSATRSNTPQGESNAMGSPPGEAAETGPPPRTAAPATGDARVDEAVSRLAELEGLPVAEHPAVFEYVHERLAETLGDLDPPGHDLNPPRHDLDPPRHDLDPAGHDLDPPRHDLDPAGHDSVSHGPPEMDPAGQAG
jgi:hypothetical protein